MQAYTLVTGLIINKMARAGSTQKVETRMRATSGTAYSMGKALKLSPMEENIPVASNVETSMVKEIFPGRMAAFMRAVLLTKTWKE